MAWLGRESDQDDLRASAWRDWLRRQHPLAIASFVLGIFSLTHLGTLLIDGIAGAVLGWLALKQINHQGRTDGRGLAWWGIVVSAASLVVAVKFAYQWV